jgi:tetrapyrrole methylase family protein/MazG family protein
VTEQDGLLARFSSEPVPSGQNADRVADLLKVMAHLRAPGGCPWDAEQTHRSLAKHLLEETHEVLEAIDLDDPERLRDELGDLLLQVVFHAEMARETGDFDIDDIASGTVEKLIRRHPHVFGDVEVASAGEVLANWERIKEDENGPRGIDEDIPATLPALARASKVQRRAAGQGFEWRTKEAAIDKLREEVEELAVASADEAEDELGDVLFAATAVARLSGVDPESALRRATSRFALRYESMLTRAGDEGVNLESLSEEQLLKFFRDSR